jgi:hypothetical protein
MTRTEHLEWAKERARILLNTSGPAAAHASLISDLTKHPEFDGTLIHEYGRKGMVLLMCGAGELQIHDWIDDLQ